MLFTTDNFEFSRIPAPLISWYHENKRDLLWRKSADPYKVWVSEIMLQQTRVEAVKEYYARFLNALPDVFALASCQEELLLKLWEGLGYYSRARNLQKTAKIIVSEYAGKFPESKAELLKLPGVGEYTAGAIASSALYQREPAVDGNVFRVISRLSENPTDISEPKYRGYITEKLREVYPPEGVLCSDFTQALMELGATVCKPQSPECERCPLAEICLSRANGTQEKFPVLPEKKSKRREQVCVLLIKTPFGIAIRKREQGVLKGMYEFPSFVGLSAEEGLKELGISSYKLIKKSKATHIFTHIVWDLQISLIETEKVNLPTYSLTEIKEKISLPTAFRQCLKVFDGLEGV